MRTQFLGWATLLLLCACGEPAPVRTPDSAPESAPESATELEPTRELFDGTVTFAIPGGADPGFLTKQTMTFLAIDKPGRTRLIDAWEAPEESQYGRHNFPEGTSPVAVAGYYEGLLANAGWKRNVDYSVADGSIHVFGVRALNAGSDNAELVVSISPKP